MILASILITDHEQEEKQLSSKLLENIESFKRVHPNLPHILFTTSSIRSLIQQYFDSDLMKAFEGLKPFSYKADLARYCIMYVYGGVYADLGMYFFRAWSPQALASISHPHEQYPKDVMRLAVFRDFQSASIWDTVSGLFSAPAGHDAMLLAIKMICENVKAKYYGKNCLCPTGPTLLGKAITLTCQVDDIIAGDSRWINPVERLRPLITERSHALVFGDKLIAVRRKRGAGSLSELGISGGNTHYDMWVSRNIYSDVS